MASPFDIDISNKIIDQIIRGDLSAQAELYQIFAKPTYNLAFRFLADSSIAEDVVHDTFIKIFQRANSYGQKAKFGFWLRKIAINECLDRLRSKPRNLVYFDEIEIEDLDSTLFTNSMIETEYDLDKLLGKLEPVPRTVLWLHEVEGLKHQEIAKLFGKSLSFSKMTLRRTLLQLKKMVYEKGEVENEAFK